MKNILSTLRRRLVEAKIKKEEERINTVPVPPIAPVQSAPQIQPQVPDEISVPTSEIQQRSPRLQKIEEGKISLIAYTPEELLLQIQEENDRVNFGLSRLTKSMHWYGEVWALVGPIILLLGTIGEIFIVLWNRQKDTSPWAALSILAVAAVLEGTFLAVSYESALIRNRADKRPGGYTELDRRKLRRQLFFWIGLALGVCITQIVFVIAQTKVSADLNATGIIVVAVARAIFTVIADAYTAFAHDEMPETSERALEEKEQRARHTKLSLDQKIHQVTTINTAQLGLRQAYAEMQINQEDLQTQIEMKRLQNKALLGAMVAQQESSTMMLQTGSGMIRALFDTTMDEAQRARMLATMQGFMGAVSSPQPMQLIPQYVHAKIAPSDNSVMNSRSKSCTPENNAQLFSISLDNPTGPLPRLELHPDVTTVVKFSQPAQPETQPAQPETQPATQPATRRPSSEMAKDIAVLYAQLLEQGKKPNKTAMAKELKTTRQNVTNHMRRLGLV